jgi:copper resistance protein B
MQVVNAALLWRACLACPAVVWAQDELSSSASMDHIAPSAPAHAMPSMPTAQMQSVMEMHDDPTLAMFKADQLERDFGSGKGGAWEAEGWIGRDFDKFGWRTEGEHASGATDARVEAFWDHAFASFWDWQLGLRHDFGASFGRNLPERDWVAFGVQGLAPYGVEIETTAYLGDGGRLAARFRAEYELLLTQRLILQPQLELNLYSRRDPARAVSSGLSDAEFGLRLRYEIRREFAPYVGIVWKHRSGGNVGVAPVFVDDAGAQFVAGLRFWF